LILVALAAACALVIFVVIIVQDLNGPQSGGVAPAVETDGGGGWLPAGNDIVTNEGLPRLAAPWGGGTAAGTLTGPDGAPAAGARVVLVPLNPVQGYWNVGSIEKIAGEDGAFEASLPFPGVFRAEASLGKALAWKDGVSPGATLNMRLHAPATVTARVAGLDPAEPASAQLKMIHPAPDFKVPALREGGAFVFQQTPPGFYCLSVRAGNSFLEWPVDCLDGEPVELDLAFPPAGELTGTVKDAFGLAVAGVEVTARSHATGVFVGRTAAGADGAFALPVPAGRYRIDVAGEGLAGAAVPMAEPGVLHEVAVSPGVLWTGSVIGADGAPLAGARVRVEYTIPYLDGTAELDLRVSGDGTFQWRSSGGMSERFHVSAPDRGPRCFEDVVPAVNSRGAGEGRLGPMTLFEADKDVGGEVLDPNGGPVSRARVTLIPEFVPPGSPFYRETSDVTDASGLFHLSGVSRGSYRIFVDGGGFARASKPFFVSGDEIVNIPVAFGRTVEGTVTGREGGPLEGIGVSMAVGGRTFEVRTNGEGRFAFTDVTEDPASVKVRGAAPVLARGAEELAFALPEGGTLEALVADRAGRPLRFLQAALVMPGESVEAARPEWFSADAGGRIRIDVPAKPSFILFRKPGHADVLLPGKDLYLEGQTYRFLDEAAVVLDWSGIG